MQHVHRSLLPAGRGKQIFQDLIVGAKLMV